MTSAMRWSVGGGACMPLRMSALGASAKAAPAKPSRPASRLADSSSDLKRDMAALLLSLEIGRHAMFRRASLYVIPITLLREAPSPLPPFGATDNLGLLEEGTQNGMSFGLNVTTGIIAAVLGIAGLAQASNVFAPLAAPIFIIAVVWPVQEQLQPWMPD